MNKELMFSSNDMTWTTPQALFDRLNFEFRFTLDVCAFPESAKCSKYFTPEIDGLSQDWSKDICWMNPPYGREMYKWMEKAYNESKKGATVVCLIPARTDTKYWFDFCMRASEIRLIKGRIKFGDSKNSAPFPSAIIIFRPVTNRLFFTTYASEITKIDPITYNKPDIIIDDNLEPISFE